MNKKTVSLLLGSLLLFGCANVSTTNTSSSSTVESSSSSVSSSSSSKTVWSEKPATNVVTVDFEVEDDNGYVIAVHIRLGEWIKGSESDKLTQELSYFTGKTDFSSTELTLRKADAYVFGDISYENMTKEYKIREIVSGGASMGISSKGIKTDFYNSVRISDGIIFYSTPKRVESGNSIEISPLFKKDTWGPVAFVGQVEEAYTPKYPNGKPEIEGGKFYIDAPGGMYFKDHKVTVNGKTLTVEDRRSITITRGKIEQE